MLLRSRSGATTTEGIPRSASTLVMIWIPGASTPSSLDRRIFMDNPFSYRIKPTRSDTTGDMIRGMTSSSTSTMRTIMPYRSSQKNPWR